MPWPAATGLKVCVCVCVKEGWYRCALNASPRVTPFLPHTVHASSFAFSAL